MARGRVGMTDEEIETEIAKLEDSEEVKLAMVYTRIRHRRRQRLYNLRSLAKAGRELMEAGVTMDMLNNEEFWDDDEE